MGGATLSGSGRAIEIPDGGMPERSNGAVSKTVVPLAGYRGFESHSLRQLRSNMPLVQIVRETAAERSHIPTNGKRYPPPLL